MLTDTTELYDPSGQGLDGRVAGLTKVAREALDDEPVLAGVVVLYCDGCGAGVELDFEHPQIPSGWGATDTGDFCSICLSDRT
jgi:hypothetical protein